MSLISMGNVGVSMYYRSLIGRNASSRLDHFRLREKGERARDEVMAERTKIYYDKTPNRAEE